MVMKQAAVCQPILSVEDADKTEKKPSIWASILCDVKSSARKVPATKSLVVLGDNESGRTTLVAKLQGNDDPKRGAGLEYHYIDIKDDDRDDNPKLGVWILDGNVACSAPLLKFAIKPETIENTMLILVASMAQPWSLLSTLKKWTALIEEHVAQLKIDPTRLREMHDHLQYDFQHYIEPNDASVNLVPPTTIQNAISGGHVSKSISSISLASATLSGSVNPDEQNVLPLADGIFKKSFGIPIIIVITKSDAMSTLEKENDYDDQHFEFLQYHIRNFCLEYGAALFYTSVKAKKNIDKLYKYIVHKCYGYPFTLTAAIVERDEIFIPAGWDNPKKVDILLENLHHLKSTDNYTDIFVNPAVKRPLKRDDEIIMAEDDQEFLSKLQLTLNRTASPTRTDENVTPMHTRSGSISAASNSQTLSATGRSRTQQSVTPGAASNEGALANFFNSLINKKSAGAVTPTGVSASVAQRPTSPSPTTPTSKRLQQHPLTFAVTPPPGRTRTPTSHKIFVPSVNIESPPKALSPVVESQWIIENTATSSPTVVGIPLEDSVSMETFDTTENQQTEISTVEPLDLLHNEQPFNSAAQYEKESITDVDKQNKQYLVSQESSLSNARDTDKAETNISFSESSPITDENSITNQIIPNDETNEPLSNDVSLSQIGTQDQGHEIQESPAVKVSIPEVLESNESTSNNLLGDTELRSTFLSKSDEFSNGEYLNDTSSTNESILHFPIAAHDTHELLQDAELELLPLSSNQMFENTQRLDGEGDIEQQLYPTKSKDEAIKLYDHNSPSNNDEEQLASGRRSLDSSCRNSTIDKSYPLTSSNPALNELKEQQDLRVLSPVATMHTPIDDNLLSLPSVSELLDETVHPEQISEGSPLSDIHEAMLPIQPRPTSPSKLEPSETSTFFQDANLESSSLIQQTDHANISTDEVLSTDQSSKIFSTSGDDTVEQEQPDQIFISHDNMNKEDNSLDATVQMTSEHIDLPNTKQDISPPPTNTDEETLLESIISEHQFLPAANDQQARPQRIDDILLHQASNGKLLASEFIPLSSSPVEFIEEFEPDESDTQFNLSHNELEVPIDGKEQDIDRTSTLHFQREEHKSPLLSSPIEEEIHQRSRSQSTTSTNENVINQSLTSGIEEVKQNNQGSQPPSPIMQDEESSRLPLVPAVTEREHDNRTSSPIHEEVQQRSTSQSLFTTNEHQNNQSLSPTTPELEKKSALSPAESHEEVQNNQSEHFVAEQNDQRDRPSSPAVEEPESRSQSPSPFVTDKQHLSRAPLSGNEHDAEQISESIGDKENNDRSRPLSPASDDIRQRSFSQTSIVPENHERNRMSPLYSESKNEQSRTTSPCIEKEEWARSLESPIFDTKSQISKSSSPVIEVSDEGNVSTSAEPSDKRDQSPYSIIEDSQEKSSSPLGILEYEHETNRSSGHVEQNNAEISSSASENEESGRISSPSSVSKIKDDKSRPFPFIAHDAQQTIITATSDLEDDGQRNKSSSPTAHELEKANPLFPEERTHDQNHSSSPILTEVQQRSSSPLDDIGSEQKFSRSSSLSLREEGHERSSHSSNFQLLDKGSRSPSPAHGSIHERSRSPSPAHGSIHERSRSPSPAHRSIPEISRFSSPTSVPLHERSRSPSPADGSIHERSRSPSPAHRSIREISRFSSPASVPLHQRSRSPSPAHGSIHERSRSPSPAHRSIPERSRSPSPAAEPIHERSRSSSPAHASMREISRSSSPAPEPFHERSGSSSPALGSIHEINRSPSLSLLQEEHRSSSPSPNLLLLGKGSRSPSPAAEPLHERSRSPSPLSETFLERSRSSSPAPEAIRERSRSPSPAHGSIHEIGRSSSSAPVPLYERSRSSSPLREPLDGISRSSSPAHGSIHERSRSPSPAHGSMHEISRSSSSAQVPLYERSRSPSPLREPLDGISRSSSPSHGSIHERSRSPSPAPEAIRERSRSPSPAHGSMREISRSSSSAPVPLHESSRSSSPLREPLDGISRSPSLGPVPINEIGYSPSLSLRNEEHRKSSQSGDVEEVQWMKQSASRTEQNLKDESALPALDEMANQVESASPDDEVVVSGVSSWSPGRLERQLSDRPVSPGTEEQDERSEPVLAVGGSAKQTSGSFSSSMEHELVGTDSHSSAGEEYHGDQAKRFSSDRIIQRESDLAENISSGSEGSDLNEPETKSSNAVLCLPINYDQQEIGLNVLTSVIAESRQRDSLVKTDEDTINSGALKTSRSPSVLSEYLIKDNDLQSRCDVMYETVHKSNENEIISQMVQLQEEDHDQASSLIVSGKENDKSQNDLQSSTPFTFADDNTEQSKENRHILLDRNGSLKDFSYPSPLMEEPFLVLSPIPDSPLVEEQKETPSNNTMEENQQPRLVSPPVVFHTENHTSLANTSLVHEYVPTTTLDEKESTTSPTQGIQQKLSNDSDSSALIESKPLETVETISLEQTLPADHHIELNTSTNPLSSDNRLSTIIRSQNSSTIARPNSLPFSPNDHDLDGLYISNDYDDEGEVAENNEYDHNSAPITTNMEYHDSSLKLKNNVEEQNAPTDANDTGKTQSIVEKSKIEDNDNNGIDSTNSKRSSN
ncbi:unnamed protein product [Rotaria socialis]